MSRAANNLLLQSVHDLNVYNDITHIFTVLVGKLLHIPMKDTMNEVLKFKVPKVRSTSGGFNQVI